MPLTDTEVHQKKDNDPPVVKPGLSDSEVVRRMVFSSDEIMLPYIIVA
jgi:hypothetical protein